MVTTAWQHLIPQPVHQVLAVLGRAGFETWLVGGCVRDLALGREPADFDLATQAWPEQVSSLFARCIQTGAKHGTVTVMVDDLAIEVTTFRSEAGYSDGRRPDQVRFEQSVLTDLSRRDFTINSMAWQQGQGLLDPFGGLADLTAHILRCVGEARVRFHEDSLRQLRAVRFALTFDLLPEQSLLDAICLERDGLAGLSAERLSTELFRLVQAPFGLRLLHFAGTGLMAGLLDRFFSDRPVSKSLDDQTATGQETSETDLIPFAANRDRRLCEYLSRWVGREREKEQVFPLLYLAWLFSRTQSWHKSLSRQALTSFANQMLKRCRLSRRLANQSTATLAALGLHLYLRPWSAEFDGSSVETGGSAAISRSAATGPLSPLVIQQIGRVISLGYHLSEPETLASLSAGWRLRQLLQPDYQPIRQDLQQVAGLLQHPVGKSYRLMCQVSALAIRGSDGSLDGWISKRHLPLRILLERMLSYVQRYPEKNTEESLRLLAGKWSKNNR